MSPFLSVIIPIYNVEPYIRKCIDSILVQSFRDFELILVDDASPDHCPQICDEYAKKDERVKVIHHLMNQGLVCARKAGLKLACAPYITFVDGDDWIEKNMYEMLSSAAKMYKSDIVICDILIHMRDREEKSIQMIKPGLYEKSGLQKMVYPSMLCSGEFFRFGLYPALFNKIFKREILEKNLYEIPEEIRMGEDAACSYLCLLDASSIYVLDHQYLYHYRQFYGSMTRAYDDQYLERVKCLYHYLTVKMNEKNEYDMRIQLYHYFSYLVVEALKNEANPYHVKPRGERKKFLKYMLEDPDVSLALENVQIQEAFGKNKLYLWLLKKRHLQLLYLFCNLLRRRIKKLEQKMR